MNLPENLNSWFRVPLLTLPRITLALATAMVADGLQLLLSFIGPMEWATVDPVIDCVAAVLISRLIGFHALLLPTFAVKLVPLVEDLPTWTACTAAVIALRKWEQKQPPPGPPPDKPDKPIIDI
jgi:hypothetical protein